VIAAQIGDVVLMANLKVINELRPDALIYSVPTWWDGICRVNKYPGCTI